MHRILAAAAALVLALGTVLLGATVAGADGGFTINVSNAGPIVTTDAIDVGGDLPEGYSIQALTLRDAGGDVVSSTSSGDCLPMVNDSGSDTTWSCVVTPDAALAGGTGYTVVASYSPPDEVAVDLATSAFTVNDYSASPPPWTAVTSPGQFSIGGDLSGGADTWGIDIVPVNGSSSSDDTDTEQQCSGTGATSSCGPFDLAPGDWNVTLSQSWSTNPGAPATTRLLRFSVPDAPVITGAITDGETGDVTISGTGSAGATVEVDYDPFFSDSDGPVPACPTDPATIVASDGTWSCTVTDGSAGTQFYVAAQVEPNAETPDGELYGSESDYSAYFAYPVSIAANDFTFLPQAGGTDLRVVSTPTGPATAAQLQLDPNSDGPASCPDYSGEGINACTFPGLAAGFWEIESTNEVPDDYDQFLATQISYFFVIPATPTVTAVTVDPDGSITARGTGVPGDRAYVVSTGSSLPICATLITDAGSWTCSTGGLSPGMQTISAYQEDLVGAPDEEIAYSQFDQYLSGGLSAVSSRDDSITVTVPDGSDPSRPVTPGTPAAGLTTPTWSFDISGLDLGDIHPGDSFTITGKGPVGAVLSAELHSTPVTIGRTVVGRDGTFSLTGVIPSDTPAGDHHIVVTMSGAGLVTTSSDKAITVVAPVASSATTFGPDKVITVDPSTADATPSAHIGHGDGSSPTAPNILTRSINSIQDVISHPQKIGAAVAIGLVLLIFATLPAPLLNATIAENYEHLTRRIPRLRRRPRWFERFAAWLKATPIAGGLALSAITAFLFGFADPKFGFTLASLRLILGLAIALFVVEYLANALTGLIVRKRWSLNVVLNIRPLGLVLTVLGVIASRALHFSPGFLIGLVLGLTLSGAKAEEEAWKAVLVRSSVVLGFGLVAWLGYSALTTGETGNDSFVSELVVETLVAITTEGIVAILVELLPFRLLEGERIFRRSRILWGVLYFLVIAAFVIAVVPWEGNWAALGSSLWIWIAVVAGFAGLCLGIYLYFRFWSPFHETEQERENDEVEVGAGG